MIAADLPVINDLSDQIHVNYPEDPGIFEERFRLYPNGCFVCEHNGRYIGYAITHPWHEGTAPKLNSMLRRIPDAPDTYYFHDIALLAEAQHHGWGSQIIDILKKHASQLGFRTISLVAVNRSTKFWYRHGFRVKDVPDLRKKLLSYDAEAVYMQCPL